MTGIIDDIVYVSGAPLRLLRRSRGLRRLLTAIVVVALFFAATLWAIDRYLPAVEVATMTAKLPPLSPLAPLTRASRIAVPVAISIGAIQRSLEASTPRSFNGQDGNPVSNLLAKADIGMTVTRGNIAVNGRANELTAMTQLTGTLHVTGQLAAAAGNVVGGVGGGLAGLLDKSLGKELGNAIGGLATTLIDQNVELRSQVSINAKPALAANWRLHPNLSAQVTVSDSAVQVAGIKINMATDAKARIETAVNEQVAALEARLRNDPFLEQAAREQWTRLCRSLPLGGGDTGLPPLWLEVRPVRASAAPPRIDAHDLTLLVAVQAETRVTAKESKPVCPFPSKLDLEPAMPAGKLAVVLPIDLPFAALDKVLTAQLKGRRFPEGGDAPVDVEVRSARLAAGGDRLLISLKVKAHERKSWFGLGAEADIHIWGRPQLDPGTQVLRLTDISLAVESEAAFGLLGTAARAAVPYLQQAIADYAVIDLTPFLSDATARLGATIAEFRRSGDGLTVDTAIEAVRLTGIAFDQTTLRVTAEASGSAKVTVTQLPRL